MIKVVKTVNTEAFVEGAVPEPMLIMEMFRNLIPAV